MEYQFIDKGTHTFKTGKSDWYGEYIVRDDKLIENKRLSFGNKIIIHISETSGLRFSNYSLDKDNNWVSVENLSHYKGASFPKEIWEIVLKKLQELHISKL